jgi:hypothetical protein
MLKKLVKIVNKLAENYFLPPPTTLGQKYAKFKLFSILAALWFQIISFHGLNKLILL